MENILQDIQEYKELLEGVRKDKMQLGIKERKIHNLIDEANAKIYAQLEENDGLIETKNFVIKERKRSESLKLKKGIKASDLRKVYPSLVRDGKPTVNLLASKKMLFKDGVDITEFFDITLSKRSLVIKANI